MTQLNLILELTNVITEVLENGATSRNIYQARNQMELIFNRFDEFNTLELSELQTIIQEMTIKILTMPKDLKDYFQLIANFKSENEIYPHNISNWDSTIETAQLMAGLFDILNDLLQTGITPSSAYEARLMLDDLLQEFEQQAEEYEERQFQADLDNTSNAIEAIPVNTETFFTDLSECLGLPL